MANRFPLVANVSSSRIAELASGDGLDLSGSDIVNAANVTVLGTSTLGAISNVKITGGTVGQVIQTDGAGNLSYVTAATLSGSNTQVQYNNDGLFGASANLTFSTASNTLTSFNITASNALSGGNITATSNVSAGNISATSNIGAGNISATSTMSAGNITATSNISGSNLSATTTMKINSLDVGTLLIPQNSQSANYTLVLTDSGKQLLHPSADTTARTFTIPANSSVAFSTGTCVTFINQGSAGTLSIAITTDTMRLAGNGATGTRSLSANGIATAIKLTNTEWIISGVNLT